MKLFGSSSRRGRSPAEDELQNNNSPAEAEYIPASEEAPKPKRTRKAGDGAPGPDKPGRKRVIAIVAVCVILILCAGTALGAAMVSRSETIYPKVPLGGVDLGGMTVQEAARALERAGYAGEGEGAVTVTLPADVELEVTAGDAGLPTNPQEGAQTAWNYGRDGASALARLGTWLNCLFTGVDLDKEQLPLDEEAIRAKIAAAAEEAQEALLGESVQVGEEEITIIKGGTVVSIDEDAIYDLVAKAMREGDFTEHSYTPQYTGTAENFDFEALHEEIFTEPKDAIYDKETGEVSQSEAGRDFDIEEAERLWAKAQLGDAVVIPLEIQEPKVTTEDLEVAGAMTAWMRNAINPTLCYTVEHQPCLVHAGPFANIAIGQSSIIGDRLALKLFDYHVTESGFGADIGFEKFWNVKCRLSGLKPHVSVVVATIRALKMHGGGPEVRPGRPLPEEYTRENLALLEAGCANLFHHVDNVKKSGIKPVVCINKFYTDTEAEIALIRRLCAERGVRCALSEHWQFGGEGALELAQAVVDACEEPQEEIRYLYDLDTPLRQRVERIAREVYGADGVDWAPLALEKAERFERDPKYADYCTMMVKTHLSLSHEPDWKGVPKNWRLPIRDILEYGGAKFLCPMAGTISMMPGTGSNPAYRRIDVDTETGAVSGLF